MSAWVTKDGSEFTRRTVRLGLRQNGYHQILEGVQGEKRPLPTGLYS
jgi:hypothetical protein